MNSTDFTALLPLIVLGATPIAQMVVVSFYRRHALTAGIGVAGLVFSLASLFISSQASPRAVTPLLVIDGFALFYMGLVMAGTLAVTLLSYGYNRGCKQSDEYYLLLLLAGLGATVLAASGHFISFFLGLETLSIALYALIAYVRACEKGAEAGMKYLVLAGASSAFLLFGMALIYNETGAMGFGAIAEALRVQEGSVIVTAGLAMLIAGAGFKIAVAPFHMWTPDIYEGAPAPVSAFIASVSKGAVFVLLLRFFTMTGLSAPVFIILAAISIASMFTGNLLALFQTNIKRVLAYSSIAHLGYLLVALLASGPLAVTAVGYYLTAYFIAMLGAFGVVTVLSDAAKEREALDEYRGLSSQRPWLAAVFTGMLLSLAGIPLTAGFVGKFYLVTAGVGSGMWLLVIALAVNSFISIYYYLRIIAALYAPAPKESVALPMARLSLPGGAAMAVLTMLLVWLGVYPAPFIRLIETTVASLIYQV